MRLDQKHLLAQLGNDLLACAPPRLSLCPWARPVHNDGKLRYSFSDACCPGDEQQLMAEVFREIGILSSFHDNEGPETTIIVAPSLWRDDFLSFTSFVQDVEELLKVEGLDEDLQIVGFHPLHCFAGDAIDDPGNYVNRAPHPALHLLRQDSVTNAIDSHPDTLDVPSANARLLRKLGSVHMERLLRAACDEADQHAPPQCE